MRLRVSLQIILGEEPNPINALAVEYGNIHTVGKKHKDRFFSLLTEVLYFRVTGEGDSSSNHLNYSRFYRVSNGRVVGYFTVD